MARALRGGLGAWLVFVGSCTTPLIDDEPRETPGRDGAGVSSDAGIAGDVDTGMAGGDAEIDGDSGLPPAIDAGLASVDAQVNPTVDASPRVVDAAVADRDASSGPVTFHPLVDTVQIDGQWVPVYWAGSGDQRIRVSVIRRNGSMELVDAQGATLWRKDLGEGTLFGGFDFDADGWLDFALKKQSELPALCGGQPQYSTWLEVYSGRTGQQLTGTAPLDPICWTFGSTTYPTSQWTLQSILFGPPGAPIGLFPVYATNAWLFLREADGAVRSNALFYPSTPSYDQTYRNAQANAWTGDARAHLPNSHIANGLVIREQSEFRVLFFTSGRVVQYADEALGAGQLRADRPFVSLQTLAGRNYGLVQLNEEEGRVALVSGASVYSVYRDHKSQTQEADPNGAIERHVAIYNYRQNTIDNRYFSYLHDDGSTHQYRNRVVYPGHTWVGSPAGNSRIAYSVYDDARQSWFLYISEPGETRDYEVLAGFFLWDIRDVTGDGNKEWIVSVADPRRPYFLEPETMVYRWVESERRLERIASHPGLPVVTIRWRTPTETTSSGYYYATSLVPDPEGGMRLLTFDP